MKTAETGAIAEEPAPLSLPPIPRRVTSSKILSAHLEKLAVVYIRQSSPQQVLENRESTARQYAFAEHAHSAGLAAGSSFDHRRRSGQERSHGRRPRAGSSGWSPR